MKKLNNKIQVKIAYLVIVFITLCSFASANMLETLDNLKNKNCVWINYYKISSNEFKNKFNLQKDYNIDFNSANCIFLTDFAPFDELTYNLTYLKNDFGYLGVISSLNDYRYPQKEYVFFLGKDKDSLDYLINLSLNYESSDYFSDETPIWIPTKGEKIISFNNLDLKTRKKIDQYATMFLIKEWVEGNKKVSFLSVVYFVMKNYILNL